MRFLAQALYCYAGHHKTCTKAMKLLTIFLTVACSFALANGNSQQVTLAGKSMPLQEVFSAIEKQTGYVVFCNYDILQKAKPVSVNAKNEPLNQFLNAILNNQGLKYLLKEKTIVVSAMEELKPDAAGIEKVPVPEYKPPVAVKGRILDENGTPLSGATVQVKKSKVSAISDEGGNFEIEAENGDVLEITYVGFEPASVRITDINAPIRIALKLKIAEGEEIVVSTGFQKIPKERAAGAFDVVDNKLFSKRPASNISTAMQGLVPGMQATENLDGSMRFVIRGTGTLNGQDQPLVVVDGLPIAGFNFNNINPNDIESITVLKDATAASIWGAKSGNGVIVITTKSARVQANRKVQVEMNAFTRVSSYIDLEQVMNQAGSADLINYERLAYSRQLFFPPLYNGSFLDIGKPLTLAGEYYAARRFGRIDDAQLNRGLDSLSNINNRQQFKDHLMQRAMLTQANISLSYATDKSRSYTSILLENNKDGFQKRGYNRALIFYNNQFTLSPWLQVSLGTNIQYKKNETSGAEVSQLQQLSPYETLLNPDGSYAVNLNRWNREQIGKLPLQNFPYQDWSYNLLREVRGRETTSEELNARVQAGINIRLTKGLNWESKFQYERNTNVLENYQSEETFFVRDLVNSMTEYTNATQAVGRRLIPNGGILRRSNTLLQGTVLRSQLNYTKSIGTDHELVALAGTEFTRSHLTGQSDPWLYGYFPEKNQSAIPPYGFGGPVDIFRNFQNQTATVPGANPEILWSLEKFVSFFGNASYTYKNKYTLTGSVRSDAANFITDDPTLRWSPLWSVGGLWHIYKEDFFNSVSFFDRLSLRVTHGKNGNADNRTSNRPILNIGTSPSTNTGTIIGTVADFGNPFLRWEKTVTTNIGIDFSILKNRVSGKIDVYQKNGEDIMGRVQLPGVTGVTSQLFNNAQISNRGIEVQLGANIGNPSGFLYNPMITYSYNNNKVTSLYFPNRTVSNLLTGPGQIQGKPLGATYGFTYLGMIDSMPYIAGVKGQPVVFGNTGIYAAVGDEVLNYHGTTIPPHTLGFVNSFSYKGFSLMAVIIGKFGGIYRNQVFNYEQGVGALKTNINIEVRDVLAGNPNVPSFPRYRDNTFYLWDRFTPNLSGLVESSSYLELKEIYLDYNFKSSALTKLKMEGIKLFTQVRNIGLLYAANSRGLHPEWLPGQNRPVLNFTFGLQAKF